MSPHWVIAIVSIFSVFLIPILVIMVRGAMKWTHVTDKLETLVSKVEELVTDQDKVHAEMLAQMRSDREAMDRRVRFMEEHFMLGGGKP